MSLMGVDVGTTGVKAVVFSEDGNILSSSYKEYPLIFPFDGAAELDSVEVIDSALSVIGKAAAAVKNSDPVKAIGIASQGEAFTPVASDGSMLGNGMTSSDCRAAGIVDAWSEDFGIDQIYQITGHTPYPMFSLYKLLWLKHEKPDVWDKTWKFMFYNDLLAYTLTGHSAADYTIAARSMLFDVRSKKWSSKILNKIELDENKLPSPVPPGSIVGQIHSELAEKLSLDNNVKVCVCGHDQPVGALGCGASKPGSASYSIGTVECICPVIGSPIFTPELMKSNLAMYPHVLPNTYTTVAFSITGGSVLRWVRDQIAYEELAEAKSKNIDPYDIITQNASSSPSDLVMLSHFGPTGTPHFDSTGAGIIFGLKLSSTKGDIFRAALEGITYEMLWNLSILRDAGFNLTEIRAVGGGSKSEKWMQIKSDILGIPLTVMKVSEATCMGAAMLAGNSINSINPAEAQWASPIKTYEPNKQYSSMYEGRFEIYKELYSASFQARKMLDRLKGENL